MAYKSGGGKVDWKGVCDSTPSSSSERNPLDQPEHKTGNLDWKGQEDGTPASSSDRESAVRK